MQYDPNTCLTAGYLRSIGLDLPASVPDRSFVPRASVRFERGTSEKQALDELIVTYPMRAVFTEPFRAL